MRTLPIFVIFCLFSMSGCSCWDNLEKPNILHPGHIDVQRARMERFDPFSSVGPGPNIDTDRPPGFDVPGSPTKRYEGSPRREAGFP